VNENVGDVVLDLEPGAHFYFKVRRQPLIVGRGTFARMERKNLRDAWETFGVGNGVTSLEDLSRRAQEVLKLDNGAHGEINCIVLNNLEWLDDADAYPVTDSFLPKNILAANFFDRAELGDLAARFAPAPADDFFAVMRRYHAHKTVFASKERHALYVVSAVDESAAGQQHIVNDR
jgi:hypothetical protein